MIIYAIDPGNEESGFCTMTGEYQLWNALKLPNKEIRRILEGYLVDNQTRHDVWCVVIERVSSYGMPVGREVFETCEWIGRFTEIAETFGVQVEYIYRREEKQRLCHDSRAKDTNIRKALIERFAKHDLTNGKGTKANPDVFYGVKADMWQAIAVAVTYLDKLAEMKIE